MIRRVFRWVIPRGLVFNAGVFTAAAVEGFITGERYAWLSLITAAGWGFTYFCWRRAGRAGMTRPPDSQVAKDAQGGQQP